MRSEIPERMKNSSKKDLAVMAGFIFIRITDISLDMSAIPVN
jgi:hypothetical protein